jgi:toxin YoeB
MTSSKCNIYWSHNAWQDYLWWQDQDKKTLRKINRLIASIEREGYAFGEGKPEPLKGEFSGFWSRRINTKDRLVYKVTNKTTIEIYTCRTHYEK